MYHHALIFHTMAVPLEPRRKRDCWGRHRQKIFMVWVLSRMILQPVWQYRRHARTKVTKRFCTLSALKSRSRSSRTGRAGLCILNTGHDFIPLKCDEAEQGVIMCWIMEILTRRAFYCEACLAVEKGGLRCLTFKKSENYSICLNWKVEPNLSDR
jgi:hypothetical protein